MVNHTASTSSEDEKWPSILCQVGHYSLIANLNLKSLGGKMAAFLSHFYVTQDRVLQEHRLITFNSHIYFSQIF